ncbi:hypothetical protein L3073_09735 [Ancylomarina sp. DW003]|nr:hypothetical protein [Ancylomarina sp. DW003]MDE5422485.1 hypothetical protein [Ancylomarina sp. DW003]
MCEKSRVVIVVNKYWECDPVCWVLTNKYIKEQCCIDFDCDITCLTYPSYGPVKNENPKDTIPRLLFETDTRSIEVWCISDLMNGCAPDLQSSSEEKMKYLPIIYNYDKEKEIELVIAVGTASSGPAITADSQFKTDNINGSVVVGSKVFMHNGGDEDSKSKYQCDCWDEILISSKTDFIDELKNIDFNVYNQLMLCPPTNPAPNGQKVYIDKDFIALGDVNVTDYAKYAEKDKQTGAAFTVSYPTNQNAVSLETTHCLIYKAAKDHLNGQNPPFMFVSGEVDRFTQFAIDVDPKAYAQNVSGAHNAGVVIAKIISVLSKKDKHKTKRERVADHV